MIEGDPSQHRLTLPQRYRGTEDGMALLTDWAAEANFDFPAPRLRVRRCDMTRGHIVGTILRAVKSGVGLTANHGGGVANAYGYPAETECVAVFAVRREDGRHMEVAYDVGRHAANKVTAASAVACVTGRIGGPWWTLAGGRDPRYTPTTTPIAGVVIAYRRSRLMTRRVYVSYRGQTDVCEFAPSKDQASLPVHIQRRMLSSCTPSVLSVQYDRERRLMMLVDSAGEQYHVPAIRSTAEAHAQVRAAVSAIRTRRAEKIEATRIRSPRLYVSLEDSYEAGNCVPLSDQFAARMWQHIGAEGPCAVRADVILAERDDSYTRRACAYAASRNQEASHAA